MSRIRVLEMIDRPFLGGGQAIVLSLARNLDRDRFETSVCAAGGGPLEEEVRKAGIPFLPAPFCGKYSLGLTGRIARILRREKPDIVHTHGGIAGLYGRMAAHKAGLKTVVHTIHGIHYLHYRNLLLRAAYVDLERYCSKFTDAVVFVSAADFSEGRRLRLAKPRKLRLVRNGIDCAELQTEEFARRAAALRSALPPGSPLVGTIARLHRQKGVVYLLRAAVAILDGHPGGRVIVAGGGELESELRREAQALGLDRRFVMLGERGEARELLAGLDVFVLPSLWEGLPLVLIEAAALGKPIVATSVDGSREIITDGETGLLVPAGDPAALAAAVRRLLDDPALAARLGAAARKTIPPRFSLEAMIAGYTDLYLSLASPTKD
jgi:glycosyltransferase involved in cell wall biosynthesis